MDENEKEGKRYENHSPIGQIEEEGEEEENMKIFCSDRKHSFLMDSCEFLHTCSEALHFIRSFSKKLCIYSVTPVYS